MISRAYVFKLYLGRSSAVGQPRGHPKVRHTRKRYYVFAKSKCRRQRAKNTATAYVSLCHMNPSMDRVADLNRAEK
jgi:hypothetical protein